MEHSVVLLACEVLGADSLKHKVLDLSTRRDQCLRPEAIDILYYYHYSMIFFVISTPNSSILLQSQLVQYFSRLFQFDHFRCLILLRVNGSIVALHEFGNTVRTIMIGLPIVRRHQFDKHGPLHPLKFTTVAKQPASTKFNQSSICKSFPLSSGSRVFKEWINHTRLRQMQCLHCFSLLVNICLMLHKVRSLAQAFSFSKTSYKPSTPKQAVMKALSDNLPSACV